MIKFTEHFNLDEFVKTDTNVENIPTEENIRNMLMLSVRVLEPARKTLGNPITITSGFRCKKLNELIGGAKNSLHKEGKAADIVCFDNKKLFNILLNLDFDQLIWEKGDDNNPEWIHVSFNSSGNRKQVLRYKNNGYTIYKP